MSNENFVKLQHFFENDIKIKKLVCAYADKVIDTYASLDSRNDVPTRRRSSIKELDYELYDTLKEIFKCFFEISSEMFGTDSAWYKKSKEMRDNLLGKSYPRIRHGENSEYESLETILRFIRSKLTNADYNFIKEVNETCVCYASSIDQAPINKARTVNEFLHVMHSYIINNRSIINSIPVISEKMNDYGSPIRYRGLDVPHFHNIFDEFPTDILVSWTDLVAVNNEKMFLLVRGRGHALSIQLVLNNRGEVEIDYFIPKILNYEKVSRLPGVGNVTSDRLWVTGRFNTSLNNLSNELFNLIASVPNEEDEIVIGIPTR